jgi:hypothetical protein
MQPLQSCHLSTLQQRNHKGGMLFYFACKVFKGTPGPINAGIFFFNMPALFAAMASTVEPRMRV